MLVYHGSKELFERFDYKKMGTNGTMEGKGFYFTDTKKIAEHYAQNGYLYTVKFNGKKSLSSDNKTITRQQLKKYLKALDEKLDYLSNWGDKDYDGLDKVMNEAINGEYDGSDNDVDMIAGIVNTSGDTEDSLTLLYEILGYDSIVCTEVDWGEEQKIYIALINDIIKIIDIQKI